MAGTIAKVTHADTVTRYFLKTYHRCGTANLIRTSTRFEPNLIEIFVYRLLNHIDAGPTVYFLHYSKSIFIHYIMTKEVDCFQELKHVENTELRIKSVVEVIRFFKFKIKKLFEKTSKYNSF
jgi:hypothetical protein